jgi:hypothetical protein
MSKPNRFILANGEQFIDSVKTGHGGGPTQFPRSYEEARDLVKTSLTGTIANLREMKPELKLKDEQIVSVRMNPAFTAKSYDLQQLVHTRTNLTPIGSRPFKKNIAELPDKQAKKLLKNDVDVSPSKLVFLRGQIEAFEKLNRQLDQAETRHTKAFKEEICRLEAIDLLTPEEKLSAFALEDDWEEGRVELVFHPSTYGKDVQLDFLKALIFGEETDSQKVRSASYDDGPTFVSCRLNREQLTEISRANPLRSAKPLRFRGLPGVRAAGSFPMPPLPIASGKSRVTVGLFDGGIDPSHPYLMGHAVEEPAFCISAPSHPDFISHGTGVAGALMYGPLNDHDMSQPLPAPKVNVESFRVLPTSDPADIDLYESIDVIESVVPQKPDIKFYNLSMGPQGPIDDDNITRFTYALDLLAHTHNVSFCVAVGNDGQAGSVYGRIQAPSDMVNGLAVGAFTDATGEPMAADYSCVGCGREGAKNKPDLLAFGGCATKPFQLLSPDPAFKGMEAGTSFSTPLATSLAAQAQAKLAVGTPLLSRALVVHKAQSRNFKFAPDIGHGILRKDIDELLTCGDGEVCILYTSEIQATKSIKLPLLLPPGLVDSGSLEFTWTVGILPKTDPLSTSDYTNICIEDRFHPNSKVYGLNPPLGLTGATRKTVHLDFNFEEIAELKDQGWKLSALPKTDDGNVYEDEHERKLKLKWEPLVRRRKNKRASGVNEPFLTFHAIARGQEKETVRFCALVTIKSSAGIDLYQAIRTQNPVLQPLQVRTEAELRVQV